MPAAPAIISAVGTAYGAYSANQANQRAGSLADQQRSAYERDLAMREDYRRRQEGIYGPLERQLTQEASSPLPLNYGPMAGNINRSFDASGRQLASTMAQRGLAGSPVEAATRGGLALGRAGTLANAFQQGLQNRLELAKGVLSRFNPGADVDRVSGGLGQLGGFFGQQAGQYGQAAQQGWGGVAQGLGQLGQYYETQDYLKSLNETPETAPSVAGSYASPNVIPDVSYGGLPAPPPIRQSQGFDFSGSNIGSGVATNTTSVK